MVAEIETTAYVGDTPWHGLGNYVGDEPVTSQEMIVASGLDWAVEKHPMFTEVGTSGKTQLIEVPTHKTSVWSKISRTLGLK